MQQPLGEKKKKEEKGLSVSDFSSAAVKLSLAFEKGALPCGGCELRNTSAFEVSPLNRQLRMASKLKLW